MSRCDSNTFSMGFRPSQAGKRTATLEIFDASRAGPAPVALTGVGTP